MFVKVWCLVGGYLVPTPSLFIKTSRRDIISRLNSNTCIRHPNAGVFPQSSLDKSNSTGSPVRQVLPVAMPASWPIEEILCIPHRRNIVSSRIENFCTRLNISLVRILSSVHEKSQNSWCVCRKIVGASFKIV